MIEEDREAVRGLAYALETGRFRYPGEAVADYALSSADLLRKLAERPAGDAGGREG